MLSGLAVLAIIAYIPLGRFAVRRFEQRMQGRRWLTKHSVLHACLVAFVFTPGCLALDLRHGNSFPLPVPAWIALATGSLWGGLLPLCVGFFFAYDRVKSRAMPDWLEESKPPAADSTDA